MTTLLDFDGTIVDLWPRYHAVFCTLSNADINISSYKQLKQKLKKDEELFKYLNLKIPQDYFAMKSKLLEDKDFLKYDKLIVKKENLIEFTNKNNVKILTARRYPDNFMWELDYLGLSSLRNCSICVNEPKKDWAKANNFSNGIIIGDDVRDLEVALNPGVFAIMVLSGLGTDDDFSKTKIAYQLSNTLQEVIEDFHFVDRQ